MKILKIIFAFLLLLSCSDTDDVITENTLAFYTINRAIETGAVIACAGSDIDTNNILTFYYPEEGATDIRFYETNTTEVDQHDFLNYTRNLLQPEPFFNGYLGKFSSNASNEKWIIVTFELDSEIKISNPIRTKQVSKATVWSDEVTINQDQSLMPIFTWQNNAFGGNAIYFQVISDAEDNLLSGTYTFENQFQYYNTSNVVLNITIETPPALLIGASYNFTLMDVSEDNWVNTIIQKTFEAQ